MSHEIQSVKHAVSKKEVLILHFVIVFARVAELIDRFENIVGCLIQGVLMFAEMVEEGFTLRPLVFSLQLTRFLTCVAGCLLAKDL